MKLTKLFYLFGVLALLTAAPMTTSAAEGIPEMGSVESSETIVNNSLVMTVGRSVTFTRRSPVGNYGWVWNYDRSILNCTTFPQFDSPTMRCTATKNGDTSFSISFTQEAGVVGQTNTISIHVGQPTIFVTSQPRAIKKVVKSRVGDLVTFSSRAIPQGNYGWMWRYDNRMLSCQNTPSFDSPDTACTVLKTGNSRVFAEYTDIYNKVYSSNVIRLQAKPRLK